jgi:hypothetical protein
MKKQDIRNIIITFVLGILVGAYLYVYGFMPQYGGVTDWLEEKGEFVIVVREYGECTQYAECSSFRVAPNGDYRLIVSVGDPNEEPEVFNGEISSKLHTQLRQTFSTATLPGLAQPITPVNCDSFTNEGYDYQIQVTVGDKVYSLDTCKTALARDPNARAVLESLLDEI